jgi:hypothetical protein
MIESVSRSVFRGRHPLHILCGVLLYLTKHHSSLVACFAVLFYFFAQRFNIPSSGQSPLYP